ncbi:MAG: cell division topological specificity factor MinE [Rhodospirillales bacterium]|nr:MAG: cell division topological specificity factor MinE [Rhodospirillales bacterium]
MSLLRFFRPRAAPSAPLAKERLTVLLTHERAARSQPEYLPRLRREILEVIGKYVHLDDDKIHVHYESQGTVAKLELDIELPNQSQQRQSQVAQPAVS